MNGKLLLPAYAEKQCFCRVCVSVRLSVCLCVCVSVWAVTFEVGGIETFFLAQW